VKSRKESLVVSGILIAGLVLGFGGLNWLVGTGLVSAKVADSIATAVEVGSWGMFVAAIAATGGALGVGLWGALKLISWRAGKKAVVA
jgi:hypothetical protein